MVDQRGFGKLDAVAQLTQRAVERGRFFEALQLWGRAESVTLEVTDGVDFYNIMSRITKEKAARVRLAARNGDFLGWCVCTRGPHGARVTGAAGREREVVRTSMTNENK